MGWDITYHPIADSEIRDIYFRALEDATLVNALQQQFRIEPFYMAQLQERIDEARSISTEVPFEKGHALYLAIVAGHLRRHHYLRGSALSFFIDDPVVARYFADWRQLVPPQWADAAGGSHLTENYAGGIFITLAQLRRMRADYEVDGDLRARLDELFSEGRLAVFWAVVDDAIAKGCGLLEASEVVEPNPMDLNASTSMSNLLNCAPEGALLYAEAAAAQLAQFMAETQDPVTADTAPAAATQKRWWERVFRR
ncbi:MULTISPECIES: hypothetical protein [unclassified Stenotrophomonas]|uniref:hypothetical protein n=1 Tax=unclassified Stenotrophomonas TaxID=196198 RepID=UPI000D177A78|nr:MULTISPECIES: hypothetical protein [unclassified Stenotrophomonas]PTA72210.1 hypothetical protein C9412_06700 [Stenotrophomonas sp. Nf1]PTA79895.1 hypothetical protein C9416_10820 [Stenotrophomonas sp. Nf4]